MNKYHIEITLKSDTTFGRGDGVAGYIDAEVEHDELGLPFLHGRTLKGLLQEECANILFSLQQESLKQDTTFTKLSEFETAADNLFGKGGSDLNTEAKMFIGDAVLQEDLRNAVKYAIENGTPKITPDEVLQSLTTIRRQTAMNEKGSPQPESLRSMRVILRETVFEAECKFDEDCEVDSNEIILLGLICASLQRIGLARNRGRGKVSVKLFGTNDLTALCMRKFEEIQ